MARPTGRKPSNPPRYKLHKASGKAVVRLDGKEIYLGIHNTPESLERYQRLIAENWASGKPVEAEDIKSETVVTVGELAIEYAKYCKLKYENSNEWATIKLVLEYLIQNFKTLPAEDFGPVRFDRYRQLMVQKGLARNTIKRRANHVVNMYQRAVLLELVCSELYSRLKALTSVLMPKGRVAKKVKPVAVEVVRATQAELTPVVADMVEVQLLTGMRPSEVCNLRPCEIDRSDTVWRYRPQTHKTMHHGKSRLIAIGPKAQQILIRYLHRNKTQFCFKPVVRNCNHGRLL